MQKTTKRGIAWILAVFMALACLAVVPTVVADTAPAIDGVKDASYTDDKLFTVAQAYPGANQPNTCLNTSGTVIRTWYTWDDTNNYIFMEITEDAYTSGCMDLLYFCNQYITLNGGFVGALPGGGYLQFTPDSGAVTSEGGNVHLTEYAVKYSDDKTTRSYEIVMPKNSASATGFMISPVYYQSGSYCVAWQGFYNASLKEVVYDNSGTWNATIGSVDEGGEDTPDGTLKIDATKDAEYTDDKYIATYNAYQNGELIENVWETYAEMWYTWDEETIYVYMEVHESLYTYNGPNKDYISYSNLSTPPADDLALWQMPSSGSKAWNVTNADSPNIGELLCNKTAMTCSSDGTLRTYEISFPRNAESDGFILAPMVDKTIYMVNMDETSTKAAHVIKFDDQSTWKAIYGEPFGGGSVTPPPGPGGERVPATDCEGIDGVKDDRYSEDKQMIVSKHFAGGGKGMIVNDKHITINLFYAWDDVNNYFLMEVHEPLGYTNGQHIFRYIPGVNDAFGDNAFEKCPGGGAMTFAAGALAAEVNKNNLALQYAIAQADGVTTYEIVLPKAENSTGFMIAPAVVQSTTSLIAHHTICTQAGNAVRVFYGDEGTWFVDASDPDVLTDFTVIDDIKAEIAKIPADLATLTLADHKELVFGVHESLAECKTSWLNFFTNEEKELAANAYAKILELLKDISGDAIKAAEDAIAALPETVTLKDMEAVMDVQAIVEELGDLIQYADQTLVEKLNGLLASLEKQAAVITIDGVKDDCYDVAAAYPITLEFMISDPGSVVSVFPATYGNIYTMADKEYSYVYVEVFDGDGFLLPEAGETRSISFHDCMAVYFDPDPDNRVLGVPYQDASEPGDGMFTFTIYADGVLADIGPKTEYLKDSANLKAFCDGNTYGFEMRVPRVEDEESFAMSVVISDPAVIVDEGGQKLLDRENSRYTAVGQYWAGDYSAYASLFYDEIPEVMTYLEIEESIEDLPAPESIKTEDDITSSLKRKVRNLNQSMTMLNAEQSAMISDELKAKLATLTEIIDIGPKPDGPTGTYGDVNGDGNINAEDALWVLQAAVSKRTLDEAQTAAADVDGSGALDAVDALMILQKAVNKIEKFPVEQ